MFHHECMRRAMSAPQSVAPLVSIFQPGQDMSHNNNALHGKTNYIAISTYEQIRAFDLDPEQRNVCDQINMSNASLIYINAKAGVGKTSLINAILYGAAMHYKGLEHKRKVVLVLVPSRELRYDHCQDVPNTGVFDDTEVLWLGRPPPGRTNGLWEDRLADSMRELKKDTLQTLDSLKAQLKFALEDVEKQALGRGDGVELHPGLPLQSPDGLHLLEGPQLCQERPQAPHCVRGLRVHWPTRGAA